MLRSKFWTSLHSQQLWNSTRHLYDSVKDFQKLLREIRKVEQEDSNINKPVTKPKVLQQQACPAAPVDTNAQLLKQMTELMDRMKSLESRMEEQQHSSSSSGNQSSHSSDNSNASSFNNQSFFQQNSNNRSFSGRGRGYCRGRGQNKFGYVQNDYNNSQNNYGHGSLDAGHSRGGHRAGANSCCSGRGGNPNANIQNLNY